MVGEAPACQRAAAAQLQQLLQRALRLLLTGGLPLPCCGAAGLQHSWALNDMAALEEYRDLSCAMGFSKQGPRWAWQHRLPAAVAKLHQRG